MSPMAKPTKEESSCSLTIGTNLSSFWAIVTNSGSKPRITGMRAMVRSISCDFGLLKKVAVHGEVTYTITPRMITISCGTGRTALTPRPGQTSLSPGFHSRTRALMPLGRVSACPTSGSGSTPRKVPTRGSIRGATNGTPAPSPSQISLAPCVRRTPSMRIPKARAPLA